MIDYNSLRQFVIDLHYILFRKPKLTIQFNPDTDVKQWDIKDREHPKIRTFANAYVFNKSHKTIEDCEAFLEILNPPQTEKRQFPLHWADTPYSARSSSMEKISINPSREHRLDIVFSEESSVQGCAIASPQALALGLTNDQFLLRPGEYLISVTVVGKLGERTEEHFSVTSTEQWEKLRMHFTKQNLALQKYDPKSKRWNTLKISLVIVILIVLFVFWEPISARLAYVNKIEVAGVSVGISDSYFSGKRNSEGISDKSPPIQTQEPSASPENIDKPEKSPSKEIDSKPRQSIQTQAPMVGGVATKPHDSFAMKTIPDRNLNTLVEQMKKDVVEQDVKLEAENLEREKLRPKASDIDRQLRNVYGDVLNLIKETIYGFNSKKPEVFNGQITFETMLDRELAFVEKRYINPTKDLENIPGHNSPIPLMQVTFPNRSSWNITGSCVTLSDRNAAKEYPWGDDEFVPQILLHGSNINILIQIRKEGSYYFHPLTSNDPWDKDLAEKTGDKDFLEKVILDIFRMEYRLNQSKTSTDFN